MAVVYKDQIVNLMQEAAQLREYAARQPSEQNQEVAAHTIEFIEKLRSMVESDAKLLEQVIPNTVTTPAIERARETRQRATETAGGDADETTKRLARELLNYQESQKIQARLNATIANCKRKYPNNPNLVRNLETYRARCPQADRNPLADQSETQKAEVRKFIRQHNLDKDLDATVDAQVRVVTTKAQNSIAQLASLSKSLLADKDSIMQNPMTAIMQLRDPSNGLQKILDNANNPSKDTYNILAAIGRIPSEIMQGADFVIAEHTKYDGYFVPPQITLLKSQLNTARALLQQLQQQAIACDEIDPAVAAKAKEKFTKTQGELAQHMQTLSEHCLAWDLLKERSLIAGNKKHQIAAFVNAVRATRCAPNLNQVVALRVRHNEDFYQRTQGDSENYAAAAFAVETNGNIHFSYYCGIPVQERAQISKQLKGLRLPPYPPMNLLATKNLLSSSQAINAVKRFSIHSVALEVPGVKTSMNSNGSVHIEFKNAQARQDFVSLLAKRNQEYEQWKENNLTDDEVTEAELKQAPEKKLSDEEQPSITKEDPPRQGPAWKERSSSDEWKQGEVPAEGAEDNDHHPPTPKSGSS